MRLMLGILAATAACLAFVGVGCGDASSDGAGTTTQAESASGKEEKARPRVPQAEVYAEDAQLSGGASRVRLLALPAVGELLVSCDADGTSSTAFKADRLLATADVVVASVGGESADGILNPRKTFTGPPIPSPGVQTWSIAEFAEADVRPTVITVASREVDNGSGYRCAVAAQATVGAPTTTITR
jgi:hypothetical protein